MVRAYRGWEHDEDMRNRMMEKVQRRNQFENSRGCAVHMTIKIKYAQRLRVPKNTENYTGSCERSNL